jgi:hypothetical protein
MNPACRVFRIQTHLDRVPHGAEFGQLELLAASDPELQLYQIDAEHQLRDAVLDLQARIDLEKVRHTLVIDDELHRCEAHVRLRAHQLQRREPEPLARAALREKGGRGGATLRSTSGAAAARCTLARRTAQPSPLPGAQDLHLDVPRPFEVALQVNARVTEGNA